VLTILERALKQTPNLSYRMPSAPLNVQIVADPQAGRYLYEL